MTLRVRDFGIATAYATVDVGDVEREMGAARAAAAEYQERCALHRRPAELSAPEVVFLLGQADVAAFYKTSNFKRILDLRYPRAESKAAVVNWLFSVPLASGRAEDTLATTRFRFTIHLRLRRAAYAYRGIEERIVDKLTELLGPNGADARTHVGLSWSDLMIEGYFTPETFEALVDFIITMHGVRVVSGPPGQKTAFPLLQRILTVFGYVEPEGDKIDPPLLPNHRHLTFLRGKPGGYDDLVALFEGQQIDILDGKADYMVRSESSSAEWLRDQRVLGDGRHERFIRKVETHLMFFGAEKFLNRHAEIDAGDQVLHADECGCESRGEAIVREIMKAIADLNRNVEGRERNLLPTEQRYAVDNALFLLGATLRDSSICCDIRDAVIACYGGLLKILREFNVAATGTDADHYTAMWQRLDDWHRLSELLLRQRTVGSYEEILGQSDRSIVHSGGVQKFLYLADQVMMDFARRVQPVDPPKFATIYDSVKTIFTFYRSGPLVRMPTSQLFSFPLIVPDLWHEVAGALFFLRYGGAAFAELVPKQEKTAFLANVADHYADIVVYLHGFRGDFQKFIVSLAHGWRQAYRDVPEVVSKLSIGHFLLRAYLVYEFDRLRSVRRSGNVEEMRRFLDPNIMDELIRELRPILAERVPATEGDWKQVRVNVQRELFSEVHRQLYEPWIATEMDTAPVDLQPFLNGDIVVLDDRDDINALFGELAHHLARMWPATNFAATAALGESAAIEYHRRQMTQRGAKDPENGGT